MPVLSEPRMPSGRGASAGEYDAFISYSSVDARIARRIQLFLERYRSKALGRRLRVFLDRTDLRGGELTGTIGRVLENSRALVVCLSPGAAESTWVAQEVRTFRKLKGEARIALVVVGGESSVQTIDALRDIDCRRHDVRRGWWMGILRPAPRLEMLRLLAFVSGVELRQLRNWHRRRTARTIGIGAVAATLAPALLLSLPLDHWDPLTLQARGAPLYAIAAEADGRTLWAASRFRAPGPQGFRNYIRSSADARDAKAREDFEGRFRLRRKLLPSTMLPFADERRVPPLPTPPSGRPLVGPTFAAEPLPGRFIVVRALGMTDDEIAEAGALAGDVGMSLPTTLYGALVLVADGVGVRAAEVTGLTPLWKDRGADGSPTSPAHGLPIAWTSDDQIWLGVPGWDGEVVGGLWHTADRGRTWTQVDGFAGVSSIAATEASVGFAVTVAESHFDQWRGSFLEPYASRVVVRQPGAANWAPAPMPPFGTRSDLELVGPLDGAEIVRVDERLFRRDRVALWRFLSERLWGE